MTRDPASRHYYAVLVDDGRDWAGIVLDVLCLATGGLVFSVEPRHRIEVRRLARGSAVVASVERHGRRGPAEDALLRVRDDLRSMTVGEFLTAYDIQDDAEPAQVDTGAPDR